MFMTRTKDFMMSRIFRYGSTTIALLIGSACGGGNAAPTLDPATVAKADQIFAQRCTPCHGGEGRGDGSASAALKPKPRNFHDAEWQTSVTDAHIERIIKEGGAAVGKSPVMPGNPDLTDKTVVTALMSKIRGFSGK
jgi:mono/diheme cytochrome c family protein